MSPWLRRLRRLLTALCLAAGAASAQRGGDLQARIVYAFQTEDLNQLASIADAMRIQSKAGTADSAIHYHLAHAQYRLGLLSAEKHSQEAIHAFRECIDELKFLLEQDANSVEALALQAACYASLAQVHRIDALVLRSRAVERLAAAFALAPRNPRVVFLRAEDELGRGKPGSAEYARGAAQLELAAELFEHSSATSDEAPGWGHAEAYLEFGRELEGRGDVLGARNWIEKSLLAAPDYKAAQRQLATLVAH